MSLNAENLKSLSIRQLALEASNDPAYKKSRKALYAAANQPDLTAPGAGPFISGAPSGIACDAGPQVGVRRSGRKDV